MTPKEALSKIKKEYIKIFCMAFVMGLIIHGFRLTNHLITWDSVFNFHDPQIKTELGRCFLTIGCGISSYYDIQWVNGLLSLFWLSATCVVISSIFEIKDNILLFFTCGIIMSFPSVAGTFAYMYTADGYMLAALLSALSILFAQKGAAALGDRPRTNSDGDRPQNSDGDRPRTNSDGDRPRTKIIPFLASIILMALSAGMYQAYIAFGLMLIVAFAILEILYSDKKITKSIKDALLMMATAALGIIFYIILNKIISVATLSEATDYNGISSMSVPGISGIINGVKNSIIDSAYFFLGPMGNKSLFMILNVVLFIVIAAFTIARIRKIIILQGFAKSAGHIVAVMICFLVMPFICFMIYFVSPDVRYYMLMMAPLSIIYLLPVLFFDRSCKLSEPGGNDNDGVQKRYNEDSAKDVCSRERLISSWVIFVLSCLIIFNFAIIDNISYLYMVTDNEKTFNMVGRVADRIETLPDYENAKRLVVIGKLDDYDKIEYLLPPAMAGIKNGILISDTAHFSAALETYFDIVLEPVSKDEGLKYEKDTEIITMSCWPSPDGIAQKGDLIILKLSD